MFFDEDSSSGVSGDLDSATTVAAYMEGYWGMGKTVSSAASARRLEAGTPGGGGGGHPSTGRSAAAPGGKGGDAQAFGRLADRIEDNLGRLLIKTEDILRENEAHILALAHALETYKTLSGDDVRAVIEGQQGPLVDGTPYADDQFIAKLRDYHLAAKRAHQEHSHPELQLPVAEPALVIADPFGYGITDSLGAPNGSSPNGSGQPYDPPLYGPPETPADDQP
jgi:hypothetical protein